MMLPAVAARFWAEDLSRADRWSRSLAGFAASLAGLLLSYHANLPSGPAIILVAASPTSLSVLVGARAGSIWQLAPPQHLEA